MGEWRGGGRSRRYEMDTQSRQDESPGQSRRRSHGGDLPDDNLGMTDGEGATGDEDPGGADETKSPCDITGAEN